MKNYIGTLERYISSRSSDSGSDERNPRSLIQNKTKKTFLDNLGFELEERLPNTKKRLHRGKDDERFIVKPIFYEPPEYKDKFNKQPRAPVPAWQQNKKKESSSSDQNVKESLTQTKNTKNSQDGNDYTGSSSTDTFFHTSSTATPSSQKKRKTETSATLDSFFKEKLEWNDKPLKKSADNKVVLMTKKNVPNKPSKYKSLKKQRSDKIKVNKFLQERALFKTYNKHLNDYFLLNEPELTFVLLKQEDKVDNIINNWNNDPQVNIKDSLSKHKVDFARLFRGKVSFAKYLIGLINKDIENKKNLENKRLNNKIKKIIRPTLLWKRQVSSIKRLLNGFKTYFMLKIPSFDRSFCIFQKFYIDFAW